MKSLLTKLVLGTTVIASTAAMAKVESLKITNSDAVAALYSNLEKAHNVVSGREVTADGRKLIILEAEVNVGCQKTVISFAPEQSDYACYTRDFKDNALLVDGGFKAELFDNIFAADAYRDFVEQVYDGYTAFISYADVKVFLTCKIDAATSESVECVD